MDFFRRGYDTGTEENENDQPLTDEQIADIALKVYQEYNDGALNQMRRGYEDKNSESIMFSKQKTLNSIRERLIEGKTSVDEARGRQFSEEEIEKILDIIDSKIYRYDIIDEFIRDDKVSDIKTYSYDNVRIKKQGVRYPANVSFGSEREYKDFVTRILERNNKNFGSANACATFTDDSQEGATLRISCISDLLTDSKIPCVAIRKIQKDKRDLYNLLNSGMFDETRHPKETAAQKAAASLEEAFSNERLRTLLPQLVDSKGILFTGKGASGKTTLMNALLELVPHDESMMICQENSELFVTDHPDCLCTHVMTNNGDSKISYGLSDLTRMGLLIDLDRIIVGEIKQPDEAAGLSKASMTGHKCWTSVHGENCDMAIKKMADYISQANANFSFADALKQVQGFEYVVHLSQFQVDEIVKIVGWDYEKNDLITECVYKI